MRRQQFQKIFWSFLHWKILILVNHTRIFQHLLFIGFIVLTEYIGTSDLLRLMYALAILFWTFPGTDGVNLDILFLQDWVELYSERNWICLILKNSSLMQMQFKRWCEGRGCQPLVHMRQRNKLLQAWIIYMYMLWNIDHIDYQCLLFSLWKIS